MGYRCAICNTFYGRSYSIVLRHMRSHQFDANLSTKGGINSCQETYDNYGSFRSHVYRKHRDVMFSNTASDYNHTNAESDHDQGQTTMAADTTAENNQNGDMEECTEIDLKRSAALFLLRAKYQLGDVTENIH